MTWFHAANLYKISGPENTNPINSRKILLILLIEDIFGTIFKSKCDRMTRRREKLQSIDIGIILKLYIELRNRYRFYMYNHRPLFLFIWKLPSPTHSYFFLVFREKIMFEMLRRVIMVNYPSVQMYEIINICFLKYLYNPLPACTRFVHVFLFFFFVFFFIFC